MHQTYLKKIRVVLSILFFSITAFLFVNFAGFLSAILSKRLLFLQFIPSFLNFMDLITWSATGFIFILLITFLFGRVYCSTVCPLGTLLDIFIWISKKFRIIKRFRYVKPKSILWYSILGVAIIAGINRNIFFVNLLDPYGISGKIFSNLFRPVFYEGNNLIVFLLKLFDNYSLYPVPLKFIHWPMVFISGLMLITLTFLAIFDGRWYCNTICPVGALLGLVSKGSLFKIRIDEANCTICGLCLARCKSGCIDLKSQKIDFSRCVACFDCIGACPEKGIGYTYSYISRSLPQIGGRVRGEGSHGRRKFLQVSLLGTAALLKPSSLFADKKPQGVSIQPVTPPGSISIWHYTANCTACHLCVSTCPTHVLQPTVAEFGLAGLFQPKMDFHTNYCNFECVKCTEICPTGAILQITKKEKETIQLGVSKFIKSLCIVETKHTDCGACSEHCPTKAVEMVPYLGNLKIPKVDEKICVGCGACEYACPTKPDKAIYVEANTYHRKAMKPKKKIEDKKEPQKKPTEDFPF